MYLNQVLKTLCGKVIMTHGVINIDRYYQIISILYKFMTF